MPPSPVRDQAVLATLPDGERKQWLRLWDDVAAVLKEIEKKK
jgi:hypothetical protein